MKNSKPKRTRLNLRIHSDLLKWVKAYAKKRKTNVTEIVLTHFSALRLLEK